MLRLRGAAAVADGEKPAASQQRRGKAPSPLLEARELIDECIERTRYRGEMLVADAFVLDGDGA
jgi:hypothetical protein